MKKISIWKSKRKKVVVRIKKTKQNKIEVFYKIFVLQY